jgi:hypothetical protein
MRFIVCHQNTARGHEQSNCVDREVKLQKALHVVKNATPPFYLM